MAGYVGIPGISEGVYVIYTDWLGYIKDDGSYGFLLQNGVPVAGDWSTITNKPTTFTPTIGSTSTTAKAGDYTPTWSEINSVIPVNAEFRPILGTSSVTAKAGNWYPDWSEITNKPTFGAPNWESIQGIPSTMAGYGISDGVSTSTMYGALSVYSTLSYTNSMLDEKVDKVNGLITPTLSNTLRPLNTIFQASTDRPVHVSYSVEMTVTASISGGQKGEVVLEISPYSDFSGLIQTVAIAGMGQTYTLAIALQGVTPHTGCVSGVVPAHWYTRLRTVSITGSPTFTVRATQEATL